MNIENILKERGSNYGEFSKQAEISQKLKQVIRESCDYDNLPYFVRESIDMILHKVARIVNGNCFYKDSWDDIAGYSTLVSNEIYGNNPEKNTE